GWLVAGAFSPSGRSRGRWLTAFTALGFCLSFVIAIKYLQLFFPPRTVTRNYIVAQSLGSLCGVALFCLSYQHLSALLSNVGARRERALIVAGAVYAAALLLFFLFPFDFALNREELRERAAALPQLLLSFPAAGLPTTLRLIVVLAGTAATIPL